MNFTGLLWYNYFNFEREGVMSVDSSTDKKGFIDQLKDGAGGALDSILSVPDKIGEWNPTAGKVAKVAGGIIILGLAIFMVVVQNTDFGHLPGGWGINIPHPSPLVGMGITSMFGLGGLGVAVAIKMLCGNTNRTAAKIAGLVQFLSLLGAAYCFMYIGNYGFTQASFNPYFLIGLFMIPIAFFKFSDLVDLWGQSSRPRFRRRAGSGKSRALRKSNAAATRKGRVTGGSTRSTRGESRDVNVSRPNPKRSAKGGNSRSQTAARGQKARRNPLSGSTSRSSESSS